jgi:hypothetical protein
MMMMQAQQKAAPKRTVASVGALWEVCNHGKRFVVAGISRATL